MYLAPYETKWCAAVRCMDRPTRAAKIVEIHKQLTWLNASLAESGSVNGMVQGELSLADFTWFPTIIFMEFMLPRVFDWPDVFNAGDEFPALRAWFVAMKGEKVFDATPSPRYPNTPAGGQTVQRPPASPAGT